jgi:hypothetical protein
VKHFISSNTELFGGWEPPAKTEQLWQSLATFLSTEQGKQMLERLYAHMEKLVDEVRGVAGRLYISFISFISLHTSFITLHTSWAMDFSRIPVSHTSCTMHCDTTAMSACRSVCWYRKARRR